MSNDRCLRAVVCDNNGTLLDDLESVAYPSLVFTFQTFGVPTPSLEDFRNEITSDFAQFYWRHGVPRDITPEQINGCRKVYYAKHGHEAQYRPDVEVFLRRCQERGLLLAIVSAEIQEALKAQLGLSGLAEHFDEIYAEAWPKTPALVRMLIKLSLNLRTEIAPGEAVYVDDTAEGLLAAKSIGMRTIGFINPSAYCSEERIKSAEPDALAMNFKEAWRIVRAWSEAC